MCYKFDELEFKSKLKAISAISDCIKDPTLKQYPIKCYRFYETGHLAYIIVESEVESFIIHQKQNLGVLELKYFNQRKQIDKIREIKESLHKISKGAK